MMKLLSCRKYDLYTHCVHLRNFSKNSDKWDKTWLVKKYLTIIHEEIILCDCQAGKFTHFSSTAFS